MIIRHFLWFALCLCAMVSLSIPIFLIETFVYGTTPKAMDAIPLVMGFAAMSIGYTIYKDYLRKPKDGNWSSVTLDARTITFIRKLSWPLLLLPFGFTGVLFAVLAFSINEWPIILAMSFLYFSMLAYFVWRMTVFHRKYGAEFLGPIRLDQLVEDFTGGKIIYLLIIGNPLIVLLILFISMQFTAK